MDVKIEKHLIDYFNLVVRDFHFRSTYINLDSDLLRLLRESVLEVVL